MKIRNITILDTSIATLNVGDEIIMDAINKEIDAIFLEDRFFRLPTHELISKPGLSLLKKSSFGLLGGSNILSSYMNQYKQWKIYLPHSFFIQQKIITLGVGWRDYQNKPNLYTKILLKNLLNKDYLHSVRDSYTEERLNGIGFRNVINTACPTLWKMTEEHCKLIPQTKSEKVVFTLTDYNKNENLDSILIKTLNKNYKKVYFWVQGIKDFEYLKSFDNELIKNIEIIPPRLKAYDTFLEKNECDYIGTRLHGGIRALQKHKRALIIGIDNRALEKQKDINLFVVERNDISKLEQFINGQFETKIKIPLENINRWKNQFSRI